MVKRSGSAAVDAQPHGWRAGTLRVLANAVLVLLAYEVVSMAFVAASIVAGESLPVTPLELVPIAAVFYLVRWVFVLPLLLPVLVGIELVARRAPHARVLTAIVAFAPMILWELTNTPGDFPSGKGAVLGATAVLFAVLARLPAPVPGRSTDDQAGSQPQPDAAPAPR